MAFPLIFMALILRGGIRQAIIISLSISIFLYCTIFEDPSVLKPHC